MRWLHRWPAAFTSILFDIHQTVVDFALLLHSRMKHVQQLQTFAPFVEAYVWQACVDTWNVIWFVDFQDDSALQGLVPAKIVQAAAEVIQNSRL